MAAAVAATARGFLPPTKLSVGKKHIGGVPVLNYDMAFKGEISSSGMHVDSVGFSPQNENWIVVMGDAAEDDQIDKACTSTEVACKKRGHASGFPFLSVQASEDELANIIAAAGNIAKYVEVDLVKYKIPEEENQIHQTAMDDIWGLKRIGADKRTTKGKGVHVYVADTGILTTHTEFQGRAFPFAELAVAALGGECSTADTWCARDKHGHGSHCAGTVGGKTFGVAPESTLHALKVLSDEGSAPTSWIISGMDLVRTKGEKPAVLSMSLGGKGGSQAYIEAVDLLVSDGVVVVVAAGNEDRDSCGYSPAGIASAITVGSTTRSDKRSTFSNWGRCVDIYAPGSDILSVGIASVNAKDTMSGTSMACPHVAGAAALLLSEDDNMTVGAVLASLQKTASTNYIPNLSPDDLNNEILHVGSDGEPAKPKPEMGNWPPQEFWHSCNARHEAGPRSDFPVCQCALYTYGSRCYDGDKLGCPMGKELEDIAKRVPGKLYKLQFFLWNCSTCRCRFEQPCYSPPANSTPPGNSIPPGDSLAAQTSLAFVASFLLLFWGLVAAAE